MHNRFRMKVKTSISLSQDLVRQIDNLANQYGNRSVLIDQGLKHESSIHCDEPISIRKTSLTQVLAGRVY